MKPEKSSQAESKQPMKSEKPTRVIDDAILPQTIQKSHGAGKTHWKNQVVLQIPPMMQN
jgi:hypothetical protein